ncbi:hypothetical protein BDN71DRAFT_1433674 [Pleurotus eryngii]|uniref:Uncharacterized protein n=1 Tax=Pleurotus eryngii TaxID=5323 RepID=A0A9P5ZRM0_PLEER|nr:hypothetical protein BDN71DRAFT_1433674 [Pleurotus eryngii]
MDGSEELNHNFSTVFTGSSRTSQFSSPGRYLQANKFNKSFSRATAEWSLHMLIYAGLLLWLTCMLAVQHMLNMMLEVHQDWGTRVSSQMGSLPGELSYELGISYYPIHHWTSCHLHLLSSHHKGIMVRQFEDSVNAIIFLILAAAQGRNKFLLASMPTSSFRVWYI